MVTLGGEESEFNFRAPLIKDCLKVQNLTIHTRNFNIVFVAFSSKSYKGTLIPRKIVALGIAKPGSLQTGCLSTLWPPRNMLPSSVSVG